MCNADFAPRPAPAAGSTRTFRLEQQLLRRYQSLTCAPKVDIEALMLALWPGPATPARLYGTPGKSEDDPGKSGLIDRIDEEIPELLQLMRAEELLAADALLITGADLPRFIGHVWGLKQRLTKRDTDPRLRDYKRDARTTDFEVDPAHYHNDAARLKALSMGSLSHAAYIGSQAGKLAGTALDQHNAKRTREGLSLVTASADLTPRQLRRRREAENRARKAQGLPPLVAPRTRKPVPAPVTPTPSMVYLLPVLQLQPEPRRPRPVARPRYQPANAAQLSLWP